MIDKLTKDQFEQLSNDSQEYFLSEGGIIISESQLDGDSQNIAAPSSSNVCQSAANSTRLEDEAPLTNLADGFSSIAEKCGVASPEKENHQLLALDIKDPVELLFLLDDDIASVNVTLHKWQVQHMLDFAEGGQDDKHPFQSVVRAPNGSGKDKYVIASEAVWLALRYKQTTIVVTSASGAQLDRQTCRHIRFLCDAAIRKWGPIWKCNYRNYTCIVDGIESEMFCFATDEPGKAEGYHPLAHGRKMALFESEAKSIPDEIYLAQNRCTGYTHRVIVSTPGLPMGHFYDLCQIAIDRKAIKSIHDILPTDYIQYHITKDDCSHLSKSYIEQMKRDIPGGELSASYQSQINAEFGTTDEMTVIPYTHVWKAFKENRIWEQEPFNKAGLDLAAGGAETVLSIRNGNKLIKQEFSKFEDTEDTIMWLEAKFREHNLTTSEALIFGDCVGIGKPMLDRLKKRGWSNIRYFDSRHEARYKRVYYKRASELWFEVKRLFEQDELILPNEPVLTRQLVNRHYKINANNQHCLLSKEEERAKGRPSPDRADAFVYSFIDYKSNYKVQDLDKPPVEQGENELEDQVKSEFVFKSSKNVKGDYHTKWNVNNRQKDFNFVQEGIDTYNRNLTIKKG